MTLANSNMGFRPKISEILPQLGIEAELARRKAEPIQVYPAVELKCSLMVGKAVVMIVTSNAARKTAIISAAMITAILPLDL
ncbi:hypothetical protein KC323_g248 [Hortaea werneckii]|nr:hypothetical protein KC323_g248 [Hortaea werneckii]